MSDTLTRKDQVLAVIKAGGKARLTGRARLWALVDKDGHEVPAWQTAIKSAVSHLAGDSGQPVEPERMRERSRIDA